MSSADLLKQRIRRSAKPESCARGGRRVLIYGMNYAPELTGVGKYTGEFGDYLVKNGVFVDVITTPPHYPGWLLSTDYKNRFVIEKGSNYRITRCPLLLRRNVRGVWRLIAPLSFALTSAPIAIWRILFNSPDIVLCVEPTLLSAPLALVLAKLKGARTVLHVQDLEVDAAFAIGHLRGSAWLKAANWIENIILRSFDAIVTISNRIRGKLEAKCVAPERLTVIRNWVYLDKIKPLGRRSTYRNKLGLPDNAFVALYSGNIGLKQALHSMLDAAIVLEKTPNIFFVIAGEGPEKARLVQKYKAFPNVIFLPFQPEADLCEFLNLADVHLLPQDASAADLVLPSKLGGMMASGKPLLVMANSGTELFEFVEGSANIVTPGDTMAAAECIQRLAREGAPAVYSTRKNRILELDAGTNLPALADFVLGPFAPRQRLPDKYRSRAL